MLNGVILPLIRKFFGQQSCVPLASSNKAARLIGGRTLHSCVGLRADSSLRTSAIALQGSARARLEKRLGGAAGAAVDEWSQAPAKLFHALCLGFTYARRPLYNLPVHRHTEQPELCGRIPFLILSGDELQLPPVPQSSGFLGDLENTSYCLENELALQFSRASSTSSVSKRPCASPAHGSVRSSRKCAPRAEPG